MRKDEQKETQSLQDGGKTSFIFLGIIQEVYSILKMNFLSVVEMLFLP